ncbi:MAG: hypothetical protein ACRDHB_03055 [Actinomycetota bacterium]
MSPDTKLSEARDLMAEHRIRRLPITKADRLGSCRWATWLSPTRRSAPPARPSRRSRNRPPRPRSQTIHPEELPSGL